MQGQCSVCGRDGKIRKGLCDAHYFRQYRTGHIGKVEVVTKNPGSECTIDGCHASHAALGYCQMHYTRYQRHGDPMVTKTPTLKYGEANSQWAGADVGYQGMHIRIRKALGRASNYQCTACEAQAEEWAYDHTDPQAKSDRGGTYSTDLSHYQPMCIRCHRVLDRNPISMRASAT